MSNLIISEVARQALRGPREHVLWLAERVANTGRPVAIRRKRTGSIAISISGHRELTVHDAVERFENILAQK